MRDLSIYNSSESDQALNMDIASGEGVSTDPQNYEITINNIYNDSIIIMNIIAHDTLITFPKIIADTVNITGSSNTIHKACCSDLYITGDSNVITNFGSVNASCSLYLIGSFNKVSDSDIDALETGDATIDTIRSNKISNCDIGALNIKSSYGIISNCKISELSFYTTGDATSVTDGNIFSNCTINTSVDIVVYGAFNKFNGCIFSGTEQISINADDSLGAVAGGLFFGNCTLGTDPAGTGAPTILVGTFADDNYKPLYVGCLSFGPLTDANALSNGNLVTTYPTINDYDPPV